MNNARISAFIAMAFIAAAAWSQPHGKTPVVTTFFAPDAVIPAYIVPQGTITTGISSRGDVVGTYADAWARGLHGFIRSLDGTFTTVDAIFAYRGTVLEGINSQGEAVGYYSGPGTEAYHGFIRSPQGAITTIDLPGAGTGSGQGTILVAINDAGTVLGGYFDSLHEWHFVLLSKKGQVTNFEVPGRGEAAAFYSLNNAGETTGTYFDSEDVRHGWFRSKQGLVTVFDAPGAGTAASQGTIATGINEEGFISGAIIDENNVWHGMIRDRNGNFTVFDADGDGTFAVCLNASKTAVGTYSVPTGNAYGGVRTYGFVRTRDGTTTKLNLAGSDLGRSTYISGINNQGWLTGWFTDEDGITKSFVMIP